MKFNDLVSHFNSLPFFDLSSVLQLSGQKASHVRTQLHRWVKSGKVIALRREMYTLAGPFRKAPVSPARLANELYKPSYLSSAWALSFFGLIPEKAVVYTSITPRVPRRFANAFGTFQYFHIKQEYFFGFSVHTLDRQSVWLAEPEKALLDFWHLSPGEWSAERMQDMRFQQFELVDKAKLGAYAEKFKSPRLKRAVQAWNKLAKENENHEEKL